MVSTTPSTARESSILLSALTGSERAELLSRGQAVHYPRRKTICAEGTVGDTLLIINTGRVEISLASAAGKRTIVTHLGPGDVVGELAALDGKERSADAVASTDVTGRLLSRAHILGFLQDHPTAAIGVIGALCQKLRVTNQSYASQVLSDGKARLAGQLLRLFDDWGEEMAGSEDVRMGQRISQSELGEMAGLTRETVNRYLRDWTTSGIIGRDRNRLTLRDHGRLEEHAQSDPD